MRLAIVEREAVRAEWHEKSRRIEYIGNSCITSVKVPHSVREHDRDPPSVRPLPHPGGRHGRRWMAGCGSVTGERDPKVKSSDRAQGP